MMNKSGRLLNILGLIDNFNSGCLKHFDNDISEASEIQKDKLRLNHLGFVYQSSNLFDDFNFGKIFKLNFL